MRLHEISNDLVWDWLIAHYTGFDWERHDDGRYYYQSHRYPDLIKQRLSDYDTSIEVRRAEEWAAAGRPIVNGKAQVRGDY